VKKQWMKWLVVGCGVFASSLAYSVEVESAIHGGMAYESRSSTGFKSVSGSMLMLDALGSVKPYLQLGIRTAASGGSRDQASFYRLATGPLMQVEVYEGWLVQVALGMFQETGVTDDEAQSYRSRGNTVMLGWERYVHLNPQLLFTWGGFFQYYSGGIEKEAATSAINGASRFQNVETNRGLAHGIEIGFRMIL